jgi:hypothetical protein
MKRVRTIVGYAFVTAFCGFVALAVSPLIFQIDCAQAGSYICFADKVMCAVVGVAIFSLLLVSMVVYDRYRLYKSFYDSMLRRIERFKML